MDKPVTSRTDPDSRRAYTRWHYANNKDAYKKRASEKKAVTRQLVREFLQSYLTEKSCIDCGERDPIVLEFDHREGVDKSFNIGDARRRCISLTSVMKEVEKCDVRCANCHRRKTYFENGRTHRG